MKDGNEMNTVEAIEGVTDKTAGIAAFFDLDGTLMAPPSLERRFSRILSCRREIPLGNYFRWLSEAVRLLPSGIGVVTHANKMYLKGVHVLEERESEIGSDSPAHKSGHQGEGQASMPPGHTPRWPVPHFFPEGVERVKWHAESGHRIVLISGTLEPLASAAALALVLRLALRGITCSIGTCATRLEEADRRWTGRVRGEAMFGEAKARAMKRLAAALQLDLAQCWAYGDSAMDRWMLAAAGKPVAVNPSWKLAQIARNRGWPVVRWDEEDSSSVAQRTLRTQSLRGMHSGEEGNKSCANNRGIVDSYPGSLG